MRPWHLGVIANKILLLFAFLNEWLNFEIIQISQEQKEIIPQILVCTYVPQWSFNLHATT